MFIMHQSIYIYIHLYTLTREGGVTFPIEHKKYMNKAQSAMDFQQRRIYEIESACSLTRKPQEGCVPWCSVRPHCGVVQFAVHLFLRVPADLNFENYPCRTLLLRICGLLFRQDVASGKSRIIILHEHLIEHLVAVPI